MPSYIGEEVTSGGSPVIWTGQVPTSDTVVTSGTVLVSHLVATNGSGAGVTISVTVHRALSGEVENVYSGFTINAGTSLDLMQDRLFALGGIALMGADTLHVSAGTAGAITLTAT